MIKSRLSILVSCVLLTSSYSAFSYDHGPQPTPVVMSSIDELSDKIEFVDRSHSSNRINDLHHHDFNRQISFNPLFNNSTLFQIDRNHIQIFDIQTNELLYSKEVNKIDWNIEHDIQHYVRVDSALYIKLKCGAIYKIAPNAQGQYQEKAFALHQPTAEYHSVHGITFNERYLISKNAGEIIVFDHEGNRASRFVTSGSSQNIYFDSMSQTLWLDDEVLQLSSEGSLSRIDGKGTDIDQEARAKILSSDANMNPWTGDIYTDNGVYKRIKNDNEGELPSYQKLAVPEYYSVSLHGLIFTKKNVFSYDPYDKTLSKLDPNTNDFEWNRKNIDLPAELMVLGNQFLGWKVEHYQFFGFDLDSNDWDKDGIRNQYDRFPFDPSRYMSSTRSDTDQVSARYGNDDDNDGIINSEDLYPKHKDRQPIHSSTSEYSPRQQKSLIHNGVFYQIDSEHHGRFSHKIERFDLKEKVALSSWKLDTVPYSLQLVDDELYVSVGDRIVKRSLLKDDSSFEFVYAPPKGHHYSKPIQYFEIFDNLMLVDGYTVNLGSWHTIQVVSDKHLYQPETGRTLFFDRYSIESTKINCDGTVFDYNNRENNAKEISLEEQYSDYSSRDDYFQRAVKENRENFTTCISAREWYHHDHQRPRFHWSSGQDHRETILSSDPLLYTDPRQQHAAQLILEDLESFYVSPDRNYLISKSGIVYHASDISTKAFLGDDIENIIFGEDYFLAQFKGAPRYQLFNSNFEQVQGGFCTSDGHCMSEVDARDVSTAFDHGKVVQVGQYGEQVEVYEFELKEVNQPTDYYVRESEENPADDNFQSQNLQIKDDQGNALYFLNHEEYGISGIDFWNSATNKQMSIGFSNPVYYSERQKAIYTVLRSGALVRFTMESLRSGNYHEVLVPFGRFDSFSFTKESVTYDEEKILIRLNGRQIQYDLLSGKTSILKQ